MRAFIAIALVASCGASSFLSACHDQENPLPGGSGPLLEAGTDSALPDTGPSGDGGDGGDGGGVGGSGAIAGSVGGTAFGAVASAYWISAPDDPATTALYVVGAPAVPCSAIQASGWSHTIPAGTQIFEMILTTKSPTATGDYAVSTASRPAAGTGEVQYIVAAPQRNETRATGGTVTLRELTAGTHATGTFDVTFPGAAGDAGDAGDGGGPGPNELRGTFDAVFCLGGHEP